MPNVQQLLETQARNLAPNGRAFNAVQGSYMSKLNAAIGKFFSRAMLDAHAVLDSAIADNASFSADDATAWEARLGIISSPATPLADRIKAINQKIAYPGTTAPRQSGPFIQEQLRAAGFNVYVHANLTGAAPDTYVAGASTYHASTTYHGNNTYHGGDYLEKVANSIDPNDDAAFPIGSNYYSIFIIGGDQNDPTIYATVPAIRRLEFRQLILQLKPANLVAYLLVNYV